MRELPIIFNTEMVRAILAGRKTQTRRVVKINGLPITSPEEYLELSEEGVIYYSVHSMSGYYKPPYKPGDRLWVRETWLNWIGDIELSYYMYRADMPIVWEDGTVTKAEDCKWQPSIHMPKEAARIWLKVNDVRVERVQDITSADVIAEGIPPTASSQTIDCDTPDPRDLYKALFSSIYANGGFGWDINPWVWVIEFNILEVKQSES